MDETLSEIEGKTIAPSNLDMYSIDSFAGIIPPSNAELSVRSTFPSL